MMGEDAVQIPPANGSNPVFETADSTASSRIDATSVGTMAASARDRYRLLEPNKSPNRKRHRRAVLQFCESTIVIDKH